MGRVEKCDEVQQVDGKTWFPISRFLLYDATYTCSSGFNIRTIHVVDFWESYNCKSEYEKNYFLKYKHLF